MMSLLITALRNVDETWIIWSLHYASFRQSSHSWKLWVNILDLTQVKLHFPNKIWKNREQKTFRQTECPEASVHSAQQMSPSPQKSLWADPNLQVATWPVSDSDIMWHLEDQSEREWRMRGDRWGKKWKNYHICSSSERLDTSLHRTALQYVQPRRVWTM